MSPTSKLLALAPASLLLACQAPSEPQPQAVLAPEAEVAEEGFDYSLSPASIPDLAPSVAGQVTFGKAAGVDVMVCVLGSDHCVVTDADGGFRLDGLGVGASEALFVFAEDHVPLVLPVELGRGDVGTVVVDMVPRESFVPLPAGEARFTAVRDASGEEVMGDWTMVTPDGGAELRTRAASPSLSYMTVGTWTATFAPTQRARCAASLGWSGAEPGEISFPVMEGAITLVGFVCE